MIPTGISRRRTLQLAAGMAATLLPIPSRAAIPPAGRKRVMMMLWRGETVAERGFRAYLAASGADIELTVRDANLDIAKVADFIAEARATRPDLIYTWGTEITRAVVGPSDAVDPLLHITDIPVVFSIVTHPVGSGIVTKIGASGRNVTGVSHVAPLATQLKALLAYRRVKRIACIYNSTTNISAVTVQELKDLCVRHGIDLVAEAFPLDEEGRPDAAAIPRLMAGIARYQPQFLYLGTDSFIAANRTVICDTARKLLLPTFAATEVLVREASALCGLVAPYDAVGRLAALKVLEVLRNGTAVGQIPIETLSRFSYIVNMRVAGELDLYPPLAVLDYAEILH
ncbi:MAG: ABC transporter substrate-binding protein [Rhodospirillaceae bacterium]